jgi:2-methylisocitrate lyase-like PEP mutase family enzyme
LLYTGENSVSTQIEKATTFAKLHVKGDPLILFNAWDAGTAKAVRDAGSKAIATGSWAVAAANGYPDGEQLPLDDVIANLRRIVANVDLPVSLDFESGYGRLPADLSANIARVIEAGAIGINFEDQIVGGEGLYAVEEQASRIAAIREVADRAGVPFFINARTDVVLMLDPKTHSEAHLEEMITRAQAYAKAGADGFFAPGLADANFIGKLVAATPLPVNIMKLPYTPSNQDMAALGVARISYGAGPYRQMMNALTEAARAALSS